MRAELAQAGIPNKYTGCEVYRGQIIALRNGRYCVLDASNIERGFSKATRAEARAMIDDMMRKDAF
jgi:hypothetical protein